MSKFVNQLRALTITQWILGLAIVLIVLQYAYIAGMQRQILTSNAELRAYIALLKGDRDEIQRRNELFDRSVEAQLASLGARLDKLEKSQGAPGGR